jgi:hypothetical protein
MAMGMTPSEFWEGEPILAEYYREAYKMKQDVLNAWEWRMGMYMASAINSTIGNSFRKKGSEPMKYPEEPLSLREEKGEDGLTRKQRKQNDSFAKALESSMMRHYQRKKAKEITDAGREYCQEH